MQKRIEELKERLKKRRERINRKLKEVKKAENLNLKDMIALRTLQLRQKFPKTKIKVFNSLEWHNEWGTNQYELYNDLRDKYDHAFEVFLSENPFDFGIFEIVHTNRDNTPYRYTIEVITRADFEQALEKKGRNDFQIYIPTFTSWND